jgi:hypothetical protein
MFTMQEVMASLAANHCTRNGKVWTAPDGSTFRVVRDGNGYNVKCLQTPLTVREALRPMFLAQRCNA